MYNIKNSRTDLLVVEASGEGEDSALGVEREHVVGPVGDDGVGDETVDALVFVVRHHLAHPRASAGVLGDVKGVGGLREDGRVVVRVRHLSGTTEDLGQGHTS